MHRETVERPEGTYDWLYFAARSGEEGRAWSDHYRRYDDIEVTSIKALAQLRAGELDTGAATLERMWEEVAAVDATPSVRHVLERWYYGVLGFLHYRRDEFAAAETAMIAAHEAVSAAVERRRFLLLLANQCHEFTLHRARISRNQRRWREMESHLDLARGMMADRLPLCQLAEGTPVYFSTLADYYLALPLSDDERAWLQGLLDRESRLRQFDRFVEAIYVQPGFAIPYP